MWVDRVHDFLGLIFSPSPSWIVYSGLVCFSSMNPTVIRNLRNGKFVKLNNDLGKFEPLCYQSLASHARKTLPSARVIFHNNSPKNGDNGLSSTIISGTFLELRIWHEAYHGNSSCKWCSSFVLVPHAAWPIQKMTHPSLGLSHTIPVG